MTNDMTEAVMYHGQPDGSVRIESDGAFVRDLTFSAEAHAKSPTGFAWGYAGSGPAALAHSLIADVLGEYAYCPDCFGTRKVAFDATIGEHGDFRAARSGEVAEACGGCHDGLRHLPYQTFKQYVVATWPTGREFRFGRRELLMWLAGYAAAQPDSYSWLTSAVAAVYA